MKPNKLTFNEEIKQYYDEVFMPEKKMSLSGYKALILKIFITFSDVHQLLLIND